MNALRVLVVAGGHRARAVATSETNGTEIHLTVDAQPHAVVWWPSEALDQEGLIEIVTLYLAGRPAGGVWTWVSPAATAPTGGAA